MHCLRTFRGKQIESASNSSDMVSSMESASSSVEPELIITNGSIHSDETYHLHRDDSMFTHNNVQSSQEGSLNDTLSLSDSSLELEEEMPEYSEHSSFESENETAEDSI